MSIYSEYPLFFCWFSLVFKILFLLFFVVVLPKFMLPIGEIKMNIKGLQLGKEFPLSGCEVVVGQKF